MRGHQLIPGSSLSDLTLPLVHATIKYMQCHVLREMSICDSSVYMTRISLGSVELCMYVGWMLKVSLFKC